MDGRSNAVSGGSMETVVLHILRSSYGGTVYYTDAEGSVQEVSASQARDVTAARGSLFGCTGLDSGYGWYLESGSFLFGTYRQSACGIAAQDMAIGVGAF
mgnify:FL=1